MQVKLTWISAAVLALGCAFTTPASAENVFRWTDDEGKVHYTPTLPPEAANRPYDLLSPSGRLIERVTDPTERYRAQRSDQNASKGTESARSEDEKRVMSDRLLMLKYRSEQELMDAMALEIDHLKYDERLLRADDVSAMTALSQQIGIAADQQRAGQAVAPEKVENIRKLQNRIRRTRDSLAKLEARKDGIRALFNAELNRFRELREAAMQDHQEG